MNFSSSKQFVKPPQRGIFPLDHDSECRPQMEVSRGYFLLSLCSMYSFIPLTFFRLLFQDYIGCLKESKQQHHKCRDLSKKYLQCRMDRELMAKEDLDKVIIYTA
jgi:cytochrome c oxidase assembly protein subunit 19